MLILLKELIKKVIFILIGKTLNDIRLFNIHAIDLMNTAEKSNVSNYKLDKILWVICAVDLMNAKSEFINKIILNKAHNIF